MFSTLPKRLSSLPFLQQRPMINPERQDPVSFCPGKMLHCEFSIWTNILQHNQPEQNAYLPPKICNQLDSKSFTLSGRVGKPKAHITTDQTYLVTGHLKNRWSMVSSPPQNTQLLEPCHPLFRKFFFCQYTIFHSQPHKYLNFHGILTFQMNLLATAAVWDFNAP